MNDRTIRYFEDKEMRAVASEGSCSTIYGHPAVFDKETQINNYFREIIDRGAFDKADLSDVFLFVNHKVGVPLARSKANSAESTMTLKIDDRGLVMRADLDTGNNEEARRLYSAIQRGDISGMSFAFDVNAEEWIDIDTDCPLRIIRGISKVYEVSVVTFPAYEQTDIQARNILNAAKSKLMIDGKLDDYRDKIQLLGGMML